MKSKSLIGSCCGGCTQSCSSGSVDVIEEINQATSNCTEDFHERYLEVFQLIKKRDKEIAWAFDDMRRSNAIILLANIMESDLLVDEEFSQFSPETRESVEVIIKIRRT